METLNDIIVICKIGYGKNGYGYNCLLNYYTFIG